MGLMEVTRRRTYSPMIAAPSPPPDIVERDDGMWSIGWHDDAAGPFRTRDFAVAVARKEAFRAESATLPAVVQERSGG